MKLSLGDETTAVGFEGEERAGTVEYNVGVFWKANQRCACCDWLSILKPDVRPDIAEEVGLYLNKENGWVNSCKFVKYSVD